MKLLTYAINKKELTGVLNREGTFVYPLSAAGMEYRTMKEVIREIGPSELELLDHIRVTRLIRESYRLHEDMFNSGLDMVVIARKSAKDKNCQDIESALLHLGKLHGILI